VIGLLCYYLYPVAPPRLVAGYGFVDTMLLYSTTSYQAQSLKPFVNPYAAMPSLHFGWAFLLGVGVWLTWRDVRGATLGLLLPISMGLAILLTANHYILDGVAGFAVCLVGLIVALWWDRGRPIPRWRRRTVANPRAARAPGAI
jgi:membrane-associated phospholipid phosphatase